MAQFKHQNKWSPHVQLWSNKLEVFEKHFKLVRMSFLDEKNRFVLLDNGWSKTARHVSNSKSSKTRKKSENFSQKFGWKEI